MQKTIRWASSEGEGLEQLHLTVDEQGVRARSVVVGGDTAENTTWAISYEVDCDFAWRVRRVKIWEAGTGHNLEFFSGGDGFWTGPDSQALPEFAGCIDVDIRATPFTNTLPIRRLQLQPGETSTIRALYFSLPGLKPEPVEQHYTNLGSRLYRYESAHRDFGRDLTTDADGLVIDYPGLFHRTFEE